MPEIEKIMGVAVLRELITRLDEQLRSQKSKTASQASAGKAARELDVLVLEERILYSAVPMVEAADAPADSDAHSATTDSSSQDTSSHGADATGSGADAAGVNDQSNAGNPSTDTAENTSEYYALLDGGSDSAIDVSHELIFIDTSIEDLQQVLHDIASQNDPTRQIEIVFVDPTRDGIEQISEALSGRTHVDSIRIVSQGADGQIQLGNSVLNSDSLNGYSEEIAGWASAFHANADLAFHGCDLSSEDGKALIDSIAALCNCVVNANEQLTSNEVKATQYDTTHGQESEVVFIQAGVADYQALVADIEQNALDSGRTMSIFVLNGTEDGFSQIDNVLAQYTNLDAIHFVSHGSDGMIQLGGSWLTAGNIEQFQSQLQSWGMSLNESGDILVYGCDVAAGPEGQAFIDRVAELTRADVAASTDKTGNIARGGDWNLEYVSTAGFQPVNDPSTAGFQPVNSTDPHSAGYKPAGTIESQNPFSLHLQSTYGGLLATYTVRDDFASAAYTNNNGTNSWSAAWSETDAAGAGATTGNILITGGQLQMQAANAADLISRQANLTGAHSATLSFTYDNNLDSNASNLSITLDVSSDGVTWVTLDTFSKTLNTTASSKSFDITSYISSGTRVRFDVGTAAAGSFYVFVDNFQISYDINTAPTAVADTATAVEAGGTNNGTAGTNPTGNVLTNDTDADSGDTKAVSGVAAGVVGSASTNVGSNVTGTYGTINIAGNGAYTYTVDNTNATVQALRLSSQTLSDVFTYTMRDTAGLTSTTQITVTIQGANDAPSDITGILTVAENSSNSTVVGTVAGQDVDTGDSFTYSLTDTAGGRFAINSSTGQVTVANGSLLNFEANTSHNITVRATDLSGATLDKLMSVTVTNVNETPTSLLLTGSTTNAGSSAVYNATFDSYYAMVNTAMTWEAAMDNAQASFLAGVSGTLININSAAEAALPQSWLGSSWIGATDRAQEGVWRWYDGDLAGSQFWAGNDQGIPAAGIYTRWASGEPNNAGGEDYAAHFGWWNGWLDWPSHFTEKSIVEWTGTAFRAAAGVSASVMENAAAGTVLGTLSAADPDSGDSLAYSIVGSSSLFEISGNELRVKAGAAFDYETARQHSLSVRVTDSNGNTRDQLVAINVVNANEAPTNTGVVGASNLISNGSFETDTTDWSLAGAGTSRISGQGATDGSFSIGFSGSNQPNDGVATTTFNTVAGSAYTVLFDVGAHGTTGVPQVLNFKVQGANTILDETVADAASDPTTFLTHSYTFVADSAITTLYFADASASTTAVDFMLDNVRAYAVETATPVMTIAENSSNGTIVGQVASIDADPYEKLRYSLLDNAGGRFAINVLTGGITVANGSLLDFESASSHVVTVRTTDAGGLTFDKQLTIAILNVNEAPTANLDTATAVESGGTSNGTAGTNPTGNVLTNDTDVDAGDTKTVTGIVAGTFPGAAANVGSNVAGSFGTINIAADGSYTYTVDNSNATVQALRTSSNTITDTFTYTMRDAAGLTSTTQITVTIQGANDAPTASSDSTIAVERGVANLVTSSFSGTMYAGSIDGGVIVGQVASDSHPNGEAFSWTTATGTVTLGVFGPLGYWWGGANASVARATSADGSVIIGDSTGFGQDIAFRWTAAGGMESLGDLPGATPSASALAVSADGSVVVGHSHSDDNGSFYWGVQEAFRWTKETGMVGLGGLLPRGWPGPGVGTRSIAHGVSPDGDTIVGISWSPNAAGDIFNGGGEAFRWTQADGMVGLGDLSGGAFSSQARTTSADGSVIVGWGVSASGKEAFRWTSETGMVGLGDLTGGGFSSLATAVSADGNLVFGQATTADGTEAFRWAQGTGMQSIKGLLEAQGVNMNGWSLTSVRGVSSDGTLIFGTAINPDGNSVLYISRYAGLDPTGNVLTNDTDVDASDTKTVTGVAAGVVGSASTNVASSVTGTYGTIQIAADGSYTYAVDNSNAAVRALRLSSQTITDVFSYTVTDSGGLTSTTQVTITIQGANDAPVGVDDTATAVEAGGTANGTAGTNPTGNLLTNDTDVDSAGNGETKTVTAIAAGSVANPLGAVGSVTGTYGSINIAANGAYTYTVDNTNAAVQALRLSGQTLSETFSYRMADAGGLTSLATVTITIQGANDAPIGVDDTNTAVEAGGVANGISGTNPTGNVLTNDTDVDSNANGETKAVSGVAAGAVGTTALQLVGANVTGTYGSINIDSTGAYTYTVDNTNATVQALRLSGQTLSDTFTYQMTDAGGLSALGTVTITIQGANDAPVAVDASLEIYAAETVRFNAAQGLLANASDVDGDSLTAVLIAGPGTGNLTLNSDGSWSYEAPRGFFGLVSFSYAANDGFVNSSPATVSILVSIGGVTQTPPEPLPPPSPTQEPEPNPEPKPDSKPILPTPIHPTPEFLPDHIAGPSTVVLENSKPAEDLSNLDLHNNDLLYSMSALGASKSYQVLLHNLQTIDLYSKPWIPISERILILKDYSEESARTNFIVANDDLQFNLNQFQSHEDARQVALQLTSGTATTLFVGASAGIAAWCVGGSFLVSLASSSLPVWASFDLLNIADNPTRTRKEDDTSVAQIIAAGQPSEPKTE